VLLLMAPAAVAGLTKNFSKLGIPALLLATYFIFAVLSSLSSQLLRDDIPILAPILGVALDMKVVVFLGVLLYAHQVERDSGQVIVSKICKAIFFVGLFNSFFFI